MTVLTTLNPISTKTNSESLAIKEDYFISFLAYLDCSKNTLITYTKAIRQWARYMADNDIVAPTREDVQAFKSYLQAEKKSASTIQLYIVAVRLFFQWLETQGLYKDVARHIKGAKVGHEHKRDYLTTSQIEKVLSSIDRDTLKGARDYAIVCLMLSCGLRTVEISRANIEDLRTVGDTPVLWVQGKGREAKDDFVILPSCVDAVIRSYLAVRKPRSEKEPLFTATSNHVSTTGGMTTKSISVLVKDCLKASGYDSPRLTAHSLRHTAVTQALLSGATVQEAQQFARHSNITTTMIYSHNLDKLNNPCSNLVASKIMV